MSSESMIQVEDLKKNYGTQEALRGITFDVPKGEVLGFLGPNGAGKTTTMKVLTCFLAPTSGKARVCGLDVSEASLAVRGHIGYLPEDTPIYAEMTTLEFLQFVAAVREVSTRVRDARIRELSGLCGLRDVLGKPIAELSKGFRQRVGLAQAMLHDPPVLILDEPTSGLDPNQIVEIRQLIRRIGEEKTVVLSTHILPEVQATCGRVIIIADGKLVADGSPQELTARDGTNRYRIMIDAGQTATETIEDKLRQLPEVSSLESTEAEADAVAWRLATSGQRDLRRDLFQCVKDNDWTLLEMGREAASLEEVFRKLTREETR